MKKYAETDVDHAVEAIKNGASIRQTSIKSGVPGTTLYNRLHGTQPHRTSSEELQRLTHAQEASPTRWVLTQAALGVRPAHAQLKGSAERVLSRQGDTRPLGRRWVERFLGRNPVLLRTGRGGGCVGRLGVGVEMRPNTKFADIEAIYKAGQQARKVEKSKSAPRELQSHVDEDGGCIVVAT